MLNSIRNQIFLACFALSLVTAGLGIYGYAGIDSAGKVVEEMYDKPLMAINLARSASQTFSEMNNNLLRQRLGSDVSGGLSLNDLAKELSDDLAAARQRSLSPRAVEAIDRVNADLRSWNALRLQDAAGAATAQMDRLSREINNKFDTLIELTADDGFVEREKVARSIGTYGLRSIAAMSFALGFAFVITVWLARRIIKPLSAAATVANRIASGEFDAPIPLGGGDETGMLLRSMTVMQGSIREMMEREAAQRRSAQNRLVDAIEGSREGMMLFDKDGRILIANSQIAAFFPSVGNALVPGTPFATVFANAEEKPAAGTKEDWLRLLSSDGEIELRGGRWLRVSQSVTREGGWFLFLSDITPLKDRESSLDTARKAAEAANVAKSNFLATMGHELRTPLNAVIGFSEMIAGEQFGPIEERSYVEYAGDVVASARHLLAIINDVLEIASSADGGIHLDAELVDLTGIVDDCARIYSDQCGAAGLTLNVASAVAARYVWGDQGKLRKVASNLISNAVKFSPPGGTITLTVKSAENDAVELMVADTGIGMRPEDIATALEPFGQIDNALARRYDGAGLGLSLTKALVELHDGTLAIDSALGEGTTVHVLLKAIEPARLRGMMMTRALSA